MQDKQPRNDKGEPHGYWVQYQNKDVLSHRGTYFNGKRHGLWEWYGGTSTEDNELWVTSNFKHDKRIGLWFIYNKGKIHEEIFYAD